MNRKDPIDPTLINEALNEAWDDFSAYVGRRFTNEITAEKWEWPRQPTPRDIVDTGNLRASQRISRGLEPGSLETFFEWTAPYAATVHDGAVFKETDADGNPRTTPARPWTRPVLRDQQTLQRYFKARFELALKRRGR
jgi:hypothetical protein